MKVVNLSDCPATRQAIQNKYNRRKWYDICHIETTPDDFGSVINTYDDGCYIFACGKLIAYYHPDYEKWFYFADNDEHSDYAKSVFEQFKHIY